jgi:ABC-type oligopeptide transport system substrate-binding subunit
MLQITTRGPIRDLPSRLAMPHFCVLPAGTPTPPGGYADPLPTAGPYYLAEHQGGNLAVLRANPDYRGTRPRHLDGIIFDLSVADGVGLARVRGGQLDYFEGSNIAVSSRVGWRASRDST